MIDSVPEIIGSSLTIATSIFVLVSAWKNGKPMYLMPWLVLQAASLFAAIGYSLYSGIILSRAHQKVEVITGYFIGCFIGAGVHFASISQCSRMIVSRYRLDVVQMFSFILYKRIIQRSGFPSGW